ncbi:MAG TPA: AmmeMemoRadiSam system radical SAM enzyme [Polyangia bacterium]
MSLQVPRRPGDDPSVVATRYFRRDGQDHTVCELCPRFCRLREGQRGLCFVRACQDGQIVLTSFGRSTGLCVDPIEKKPLYHFLPGTPVLSFGTAGCNLACKFCQNWESTRSREVESLSTVASPIEIARAAQERSCPSVAMTYNDPVVFHEYAIAVAEACHELGIKAVAVSAGYVCAAPRAEFYGRMDAANVDLKAFTDRFYRDLCAGDLSTVLDTLVFLRDKTKVWLEVTTLLIPGENDSDNELDEMTRWLAANLGPDVPLHFSAFHPDFHLRDKPPTPRQTLTRARQIAMGNGLHWVYTGNVRDSAGSTTLCTACGKPLIARDGYELVDWNLSDDGHCVACGAPCPGVFAGPPGRWGNRRLSL